MYCFKLKISNKINSMKKIKNLLVELLAAFVLVSGVLVANTETVLAESVFVVSGIEGTYQFTGEAITPEPIVKLGDETLVKDQDYEVSYTDNIDVSSGKATVTIVGKAGSGYASVDPVIRTFDITGKVDLSTCELYVKFDGSQNTNFEWTGSEIKPVISLRFVNQNGKILDIDNTGNKNFTVSYTNNVMVDNGAAVATVKATETGSFTRERDFNFYIQRKTAEIDNTRPVTLSEELTYNGNNQQLITSPMFLVEADSCAKVSYAFGTSETSGPAGGIYYSDYRDVVAKNAGTYYVYAHIDPQDMNCGYATRNIYIGSVVIGKAKYDVTTPRVNSSLTYNGLERVLTNLDDVQGVGVRLNDEEARSQSAATTGVPVIEYAFGANDTTAPVNGWVSSPLKQTNAGTYYVWYRVVALDDNHLSETAKPLTVTIKKYTPTILLEDKLDAIYDGGTISIDDASVILVNGETYNETSHGEITYAYYLNPTCTEASKVTSHKDAATYYVVATLNATPESNYDTVSSAYATLRISKANSRIITAPTSENLDEDGFYNFDYTGSNISLIIPGTQTGGNFIYAVTKESVSTAPANDSEKWSENIPVGKTAGDYKVWYRVKGDENHYDTTVSSLTVHINKAEVTVPTVSNIVFDGEHHNSGITNSADKLYTVDTINDDKGGTNKGTYKVTLKLKDTANYIWRGDDDYKAYNTGATKNPNKEIEYNITALNISTGTITLSENRPEYTGDYVTPSVTKVEVNGLEIDPSGYDVTYQKHLHASEGRGDDENYKPVVIVTAKANSNYTGSCSLPFTINRKSIANTTITFTNGQSYVWENAPIKPAIVVKDGNTTLEENVDYTVSYSNNTDVTTAQSKAVVTITGIGDYKESNSENFEITQLHLNSPGVTITCDTTSNYIYTGYGIKPTVTISYKQGSGTGTLVEGTDFEVIYGNNVNVTSATSKATIKIVLSENTNKNVSGTDDTRTFNIIPKNLKDYLSSTNITIDTSATTTACVWNGQEQEPTVYVRDLTRNRNNVDETHLVLGTDYTVYYRNNTDAGTAVAYAVGTGNYVGTISKEFTIEQYDVSTQYDISYDSTDKVYTGSPIEPTIVVKYNNQNSILSEDDYEVSYEDNKNVGTAKITINITNSNCPGVKYVYFKIVQRDLTSKAVFNTTNDTLSFPWCGQNIEPIFTIKDDLGNELENGVDYTLSDYSTNSAIGDYTVTATFANNYKGSKDVVYKIRSLTLDDVRVYEWENRGSQTGTVISKPGLILSSSTYDGTQQRKDVEIQYQNQVSNDSGKIVYSNYVDVNTLTNDSYQVKYTNDVNAGTANVQIKMDYVEGTKPAHFDISSKDNINLTFTINPKTISNAKIEITDGLTKHVWKNDDYEPSIKVTDSDIQVDDADKVLVISTETVTNDYSVAYTNNKDVTDAALITVTGQGNYTGTVTKKFTISALTHDDLDYSYAPTTEVFNYNAHENVRPTLTYKAGTGATEGTVLSENFYSYTYNNHTNAGTNTAEIIITLEGDNTAKTTKTYNFSIAKKDLSDLSTTTYTTTNGTTEFAWCGEDVIPVFVIKDGSHVLIPEDDYTLSYINEDRTAYEGYHIEPDTYYVLATFTGNYSGTKVLTYNVRKLTLKDDVIVVEWPHTDGHKATTITNGKLSDETYKGADIYKDVELQYLSHVYYEHDEEKDIYKIAYSTYKKLSGNDGYEPKYKNNKNASLTNDAEVTLTINPATEHIDITGENRNNVKLTFKIIQKSVKDAVTIKRKDENTVKSYAWRGTEYKPEITVTDDEIKAANGIDLYELNSNDYSVTYDDNTDPGDATITITGKGNYTGSETLEFNIHALGHDDLVFSYSTSETFDYGEHPVTPILTYGPKTGNPNVQLDSNYYRYTWTNHTNATNTTNKATVNVTLVGEHTTKALKAYEFTIAQRDISEDMIIQFAGNKTQYNWCGNPVKPVVTVSDGINHPLKKGKDYTVSYLDNTELTTDTTKAKLTVTGIGNYCGSKTVTFEIVPININDIEFYNYDNNKIGTKIENGIMPSEIYDGTFFKKEFVARYYSTTDDSGTSISYDNLVTIDNTNDVIYTTKYQNHKDAGTATVTVTINNTEAAKHFTGSKEFTFVIYPKDISGDVLKITNVENEYPWKGEAWTPKPTVKINATDVQLYEGTEKDYTLAYEDNTDVGENTAIIKITGNKNYTGEKKVSFSIRKIKFDDVIIYSKINSELINADDINEGTNNLLHEYTYSGGTAKPQVVLKLKNNLTKEIPTTDYEVNYPNENENVTEEATAKVTIIFKNDTYMDKSEDQISKDCYFKIVPRSIDNVTITSLSDAYAYTNEKITPTYKVTDFSGKKELKKNVDYEEVGISNNINVGKGVITIKGKGNYTTTEKTGEFVIRKLSFEDLDVKYKVDESTYKVTHKIGDVDVLDTFTYNGKPIHPEIIVVSKIDGSKVELSKDNGSGGDYSVTYSQTNDQITHVADNAYVTIKLKGNKCEGEKTFKIDVQPRDITSATFSLTEPEYGYNYNGKPIKPLPEDLSVIADGVVLSDDDYVISYTDNIEISSNSNKPKITITGVGDFCGSKSKEFTINDSSTNPDSTTISVSQEIDGDILIASNNEYYINNLLANNLSKVVLTINGITRTYVNTEAKQDITKVGNNSIVIPYSNFEDINKNLEKDSKCIKVDLQVITPGATTEQNYTSTRSFDGIQTTRGIERLDLGQLLSNNYLDYSESIYVDGVRLTKTDNIYKVIIYDGAQRTVQTYTYNDTVANLGDKHKQYSNGTRVYTIDQDTTGHAVLNELTGLKDALSYAGTSIRVTGKHGVRFFTSISRALNDQLKSVNGVNGYKAIEYGTVAGYAENIAAAGNSEPLVVLGDNNKYTGVAKTAKASAYTISGGGTYYSQTSSTLTYSNPIVESNVGDFNDVLGNDFAVRAYMILRPVSAADGDTSKDIIIYTGTIYRSISYVATQVLGDYAVGSANYNYVNSLIQR